ncbi:MAG: hypothetical protein ACXADO_00775 [Candidatus Thorarchaeota archaeon]
MSKAVYRYVGHIRTNSFRKAIGMFDPERIVRLKTFRSVKKDTIEKEVHKKFAFREVQTIESFIVDWNRKQHGCSFPECPIVGIDKMISAYALGDSVLEELEYEFVDPQLIIWLNDEIERRATANGKKREDIVFLPEVAKLYATFRNCTTPDLRALKYIHALNKDVIEKYKFKLGALDIVSLHTERSKKYGEKEKIPVHEFVDIPKRVLKNLKDNGWSESDRRVTVEGITVCPKPLAIRQYKVSQKSGWVLQQEIEVG